MAESFEYSREWTDAEAFPLLGFTRNWENPADFPTIEMDETKVRQDMQSLHDEVKDYINDKLIPAVLAEDATEASRAAAEEARQTAETSRSTAEKARVTAEDARVEAENARAEAEQARVNENTGIVAQATAKATAAADSAAKALNSEENAKAWSEGGAVAEDGGDGMLAMQLVPGAKYYAEKAKACANGGSYDPDPTDGTAERTYTSGAKNMADKARAWAEGGSYKEYVADTSAPGTYNLVTKTVADAESAKGYAQRAEQAAIKQPIIKNGTWWVWNASSGAYTDTGVSAGGTGGGTSDQVFIAEYDVTTNAELLAAYQSGKICFVKYSEQYVPVTIVQADYNSNFVLKGYIIIAESVPGVYVNEVNQTVIVSRYDTGWSIGNRALSVDDALSETSENPVQNKAIYSALKDTTTYVDSAIQTAIGNAIGGSY